MLAVDAALALGLGPTPLNLIKVVTKMGLLEGNPALAALLGTKSIGEALGSYNMAAIYSGEAETLNLTNFCLAPSFGKLTSESAKMIDDRLKVIAAGALKTIEKMKPEDRTWSNVQGALRQCGVLEPMEAETLGPGDIFYHPGESDSKLAVFQVDGSPDQEVMQQINAWFHDLVCNDQDIVDSTNVDIGSLSRIVASSGATIRGFDTFFLANEEHSKTVLEIGVLRYPDMDHPYLKLYRLKVTAQSKCWRVLFVEHNRNSLVGEFTMQRFKLRESVWAELKEPTIKKAVEEFDSLFD